MRLVEDVDLVAAGDRRERDLLAQVADVVDRVVGRRVHLDDVERRRARRSRRTSRTSPHGLDGRARCSQFRRRREDLGHRGLARPARADEQVGVVDLALLDRVAQRAHDVLLADHVGEGARAVAAVQRGGGGHGRPSRSRSAGGGPSRRRRHVAGAPMRVPAPPLELGLGARAGSSSAAGFANYDTALRARLGARPGPRAAARTTTSRSRPTPHPLQRWLGVVPEPAAATAAARRARSSLALPRARRARLGHLRARRALVRPAGRAARGGDRPHAPAGPRLRRAGLRRHPLPRARARARCSSRRGGRAPARRCSCCSASPGCCARRRGCSPAPTRLYLLAGRRRDLRRLRRWSPPPRRPCSGSPATSIVTGDPLHSLTGTRDTARELGRVTGLRRRAGHGAAAARRDPARAGPRRRGGGLVLALAVAARPRARCGAAVGVARARRVLRARRRRPADPRPLPAAARDDRSRSSAAPARSAGCELPRGRPVAPAVGAVRRGDRLAAASPSSPPRSTASASCAPRWHPERDPGRPARRSRDAAADRAAAGRVAVPTTARSRCSRCGSTARPQTSSPRSSSHPHGQYLDPPPSASCATSRSTSATPSA